MLRYFSPTADTSNPCLNISFGWPVVFNHEGLVVFAPWVFVFVKGGVLRLLYPNRKRIHSLWLHPKVSYQMSVIAKFNNYHLALDFTCSSCAPVARIFHHLRCRYSSIFPCPSKLPIWPEPECTRVSAKSPEDQSAKVGNLLWWNLRSTNHGSVENGCISKVTPVETIFHFHVYGKKVKSGSYLGFALGLIDSWPRLEGIFLGRKKHVDDFGGNWVYRVDLCVAFADPLQLQWIQFQVQIGGETSYFLLCSWNFEKP